VSEPLPFASIIVPTFRRPEALTSCLEALRRLDYPSDRFEILVVDDGSPEPVAIPPGPAQPPVRLIRQENRGPAVARNRAAAEAVGDILAFTDDDCRPRRGWLRALTLALVEHPNALVGGRTHNALAMNPWAEASQSLVGFLYDSFETCRDLRPFYTSNNFAGRRDVFTALGGFDESFRYSAAEDRDLSERWSAQGALRLVPDAHVDHHHTLGGGTFLRQHHRYGRGAMHLARRRRDRGDGPPVPEPLSFYWRMFTYPIRQNGFKRGMVLSALIGVAQIAGVSGMITEALRPHPSSTAS
jgi:GT2 family glycosyltransferase